MVRAEQLGLGLHGVGNRRRALFASAAAPSSEWTLPVLGLDVTDILHFDAGFGRFSGTPVAGPSADENGPAPLAVLPWRFLALIEISNFAPLRRHLGAPRADCLVLDVADRVAEQHADARLAVVGRTTIEIAFEGDEPLQLHNAIDAILTLFATPIDLDGEAHLIEIAVGAVVAETSVADDVRLIEEAEEALAQARIDQRPVYPGPVGGHTGV